MQIDGPVLLYGAGREARSTRAFLAERFPGIKVFVTVDSGEADLPDSEQITPEQARATIEDGGIATIIKSPGVSIYKSIFDAARANSVAITSNLNLWGEFFREGRNVVAITGTKGKSTTASLLHLMLTKADIDAGLAGNVGRAPLDIADKHKIVVFELSSYQTTDMNFAADIAAVTTLYPEHIDWHGTVETYYNDKLNLIAISPVARLAFGPQAATRPEITRLIDDAARLLPALDDQLENDIRDRAPKSKLKGQHNIDNAVLAARLATHLGAEPVDILDAIETFQPLPHRLQEYQIGDLTVVDDSISTTPEATKAAIAAYFGREAALIGGGFDRKQDYNELARQIALSSVRLVACLPDTGTRLAKALEDHAPQVSVIESENLEEAVKSLALRRSQFDTLILSPGAPSYNHYKSFQERGDAFIRFVKEAFIPVD